MFDISPAAFSRRSLRAATGCQARFCLNVPFFLSFPQIRIASKLNAKTILDIDNAKLAADDFKMK